MSVRFNKIIYVLFFILTLVLSYVEIGYATDVLTPSTDSNNEEGSNDIVIKKYTETPFYFSQLNDWADEKYGLSVYESMQNRNPGVLNSSSVEADYKKSKARLFIAESNIELNKHLSNCVIDDVDDECIKYSDLRQKMDTFVEENRVLLQYPELSPQEVEGAKKYDFIINQFLNIRNNRSLIAADEFATFRAATISWLQISYEYFNKIACSDYSRDKVIWVRNNSRDLYQNYHDYFNKYCVDSAPVEKSSLRKSTNKTRTDSDMELFAARADYNNNLEIFNKISLETKIDFLLSVTPYIGCTKDFIEFTTGKNYVTQKKLEVSDRAVSAVGVASSIMSAGLVNSGTYKALNKIIKVYNKVHGKNFLKTGVLATEYSEKVIKSAVKIRANTSEKINSFAQSFKFSNPNAIEKVDEIATNISKSDSFIMALEAVPVNKPMFYVRASGEAIPSTGFKYVDSKSLDIQKIISEGHLPARSLERPPHYGSFNKFDNSDDAINALQLPKNVDGQLLNDARYRVEFDTLQLADELKIPNGKWGEASYLEPITKDFTGFGDGGATQVIFRNTTKVTEVVDLLTGKIIFSAK